MRTLYTAVLLIAGAVAVAAIADHSAEQSVLQAGASAPMTKQQRIDAAVAWSDAQWDCTNARLCKSGAGGPRLKTKCTKGQKGCKQAGGQVGYQCAEFVSRSLSAGGFLFRFDTSPGAFVYYKGKSYNTNFVGRHACNYKPTGWTAAKGCKGLGANAHECCFAPAAKWAKIPNYTAPCAKRVYKRQLKNSKNSNGLEELLVAMGWNRKNKFCPDDVQKGDVVISNWDDHVELGVGPGLVNSHNGAKYYARPDDTITAIYSPPDYVVAQEKMAKGAFTFNKAEAAAYLKDTAAQAAQEKAETEANNGLKPNPYGST